MQKKPSAVKRLQGTSRKDRVPVNEPLPAAPPHLSTPAGLPKESQKLWRQLAPELERLGLLTAADLPALLMTCVSGGLAIEAAKMIRSEGLFRRDENGVQRKHPAAQVFRDAAAGYFKQAAKFGLTPVDRSGLSGLEPKEETLAEFLQRVTLVVGE